MVFVHQVKFVLFLLGSKVAYSSERVRISWVLWKPLAVNVCVGDTLESQKSLEFGNTIQEVVVVVVLGNYICRVIVIDGSLLNFMYSRE